MSVLGALASRPDSTVQDSAIPFLNIRHSDVSGRSNVVNWPPDHCAVHPLIVQMHNRGDFPAQAARIDARKLSTSSLSRLAWLDGDGADDSVRRHRLNTAGGLTRGSRHHAGPSHAGA